MSRARGHHFELLASLHICGADAATGFKFCAQMPYGRLLPAGGSKIIPECTGCRSGSLVDWCITALPAQTGYMKYTLCTARGQDKHTVKQ